MRSSINSKVGSFHLPLLAIDFTNIAVSSKDFSQTIIDKANYQNVDYCYEVKQKKEEYGGATLKFGSILCDKKFMVDKNSKIEIKNNEL